MKTTNLAVLLLFLSLALLVLLGCLGIYAQRENTMSMRTALLAASERSDALEQEIASFRAEQARMEREHSEQLRALQPASDLNPAATNSTSTNKPAYPQTFQARTYAGDKYIGLAWVLPSNVTEDEETGQLRFEPVILLSDAARKAITQTTTNYVEREVVRNNTLHQNWVYQQPYSYGYPVWIRNDEPSATNLPSGNLPPRLPSPGMGYQRPVLTPATGDIPAGARGRIVPPAAPGSR